ncbi:thiol reductant ABC exporter subunit CydD [Streptomyces sp. BR123]|uniref:thiol reductant ABC exporter subunit CydD n=1 Tax=Streptomyces sp. BR123 TaxID=2749828 RepID=UPI0015C4D108|nr:thiol reductant ABC exporter subunit CydD [Streptomyces sp. BR123]NXY94287.1 thiol reductant ABC exporter subunit CydD [Streptomyces sp. BR123]
MKPIDPRLLRYARSTRLFLAAVVALGCAGAGVVIGQAMLIAEIVVGAFEEGLDGGQLRTPLLLLAAVAVGRGLLAWLTELAAHRAAASVKSELRARLLERAAGLGPGWLSGQRTGSLVALATRGVDALDDYFARYLPQLGLAVAVPVAVLARIVTEDWVSAAIIVVTLPLIPLFMVLIGMATQSRMNRQWRLLSRLSGHFLDVVAGLPTLKVFGRAKAQAESIRRITEDYRRATMRTLRIAFLSSFALELLATLSVALVAVTIGMRLVHGELDLYTGLVVLILAPEAYLPLRQVGAQYHAAAEGLAAAEEVFEVLQTPAAVVSTFGVGVPGAEPSGLRIEVDRVSVRHPGRGEDSPGPVSFTVGPGECVALTGPSGAGKSTLLHVLLGFTAPTAGRVRIGDADLAGLAPGQWRERIAWVPQRPHLFAGTLAENVRLARPDASDAAVAAALDDAGAGEFVAALPRGIETVLGEGGAGLSAGQRQRIALARAFLADRPVLLLDEPTAALDGETEAAVVEAVRRLAVGRTVLLVVHRPALLALADRVVEVGSGPAGAPAASPAPESRLSEGRTLDRRVPESRVPAPRTPESADTAPRSTSAGAGWGASAGRHPLRRVRGAAKAWQGRFRLGLLLGALAVGCSVGLMAVSGWLISRASQQPPVLYLMVAVTATRTFGIGRAVFRYAERLVSHDAVLRMLSDLRVSVFRRLERIAPAGLPARRRGDLLARLVADADALQDYWLRWLLPVGTAALVGGGSVAFTAWLLPEAGAALAVGLLAAGIGVPLLSGACSRRAERRLAPARGELATRTADVLTGTAELTVAGALGRRMDAVQESDRTLTAITARGAAATGLGSGLSVLVSGLTVVAAAAFAAGAVQDGRLSGVAMAVAVLTPLAAFEAVTGLPQAVQFRQRVRRSAERVYEVVDAPAAVAEPERPEPVPASPFPLRLAGLTARHPGQEGDALHCLDLTLEEGRRTAVVGVSGAGKSTLAQVLLRFLDPRAGSYTLGGTDARLLDGDEVRRIVGLCAQDAHIFDSSVRENLRLARPAAGEEELRGALAAARLLEWADGLPDGLDTLVGEHGERISGGQRQRLALARALLADFPVLVLDEPAEHLDLATADALTADLLAATQGRTTVLITHRLAGLEAVDEVLVLDGGAVVQRGAFAELSVVEGPLRRMLEREAAADVALADFPPVKRTN